MSSFAVALVLWICCVSVMTEYLQQENYHEYLTEYAPKYHDYKPKDYHFHYGVSDPHTGDHKSQWEVKENGRVRGMYSLLEPDGTTRIVEYVADDDGFRAVVKKLGNPIPSHHHDYRVSPLADAYQNGYHGAYNGHVENYAPTHVIAPAGIENSPGYHHATPVALNGYPVYHQEHPKFLIAPAEIEDDKNVHSTVEIHGFTGNSDDDSGYTNYNDEGDQVKYYKNVNYNYQPQQQIYSIPYQYQQPYPYNPHVYGHPFETS